MLRSSSFIWRCTIKKVELGHEVADKTDLTQQQGEAVVQEVLDRRYVVFIRIYGSGVTGLEDISVESISIGQEIVIEKDT